MSIFPEFQPIQFEEYLPNECRAEEYDFQSIAEQGDYATFQVRVAPCDGVENVMPNPEFDPDDMTNPWTVEGGITQPGTGACKPDNDTTGQLLMNDVFVIGVAYQIQIYITSLSGSIQLYNGSQLIGNVVTQGLSTFSFVATDNPIAISFDNPDSFGCIGYINSFPFSADMAFGIIDENGDTAFVADFENNPQYFTFVENTVTIRFLWSDLGLTDGCYRIGFAGGCINTNAQFGIFNEGFCSGDLGWMVDNGNLADGITFDLDGDPLECTLMAENDPVTVNAIGSITSSVTQLTIGMCYEVTIPSITTGGDGVVTFNMGTAAHNIDLQVAVFPYTFQLTCTGNTEFSIVFDMETSNLILMEGGFQLRLCDPTDYEFDFMSQSFKLAHDHPCSHLLSLTCDDNALNYVFVGSGFEPNVRLISEMYNSTPEELREIYHDNLGRKKVTYGEYRKHFFFVAEHMPAWLIDFFPFLCRIADTFYIDGEEYFIEGEAQQPEWADDITNFGVIRIEVSKNPQLTRNGNINSSICDDTDLQGLPCDQINDVEDGLTISQRASLYLVNPLKTGQTTEYENPDDGTLERGRGEDFFTLTCANWFDNTNRFTAIDGTQTLVDDLMLDWQTGLMWYVLPRPTLAGDWSTGVVDGGSTPLAGYSDWAMANITELLTLVNYGQNDTLNYSPLSVAAVSHPNLWSSTTDPNTTTNAFRINPANGQSAVLAKSTTSVTYMVCRYFTKDDLGL